MNEDAAITPEDVSERPHTALALTRVDAGRFAMIGGLPTSALYLAADFARDLMHRAWGACDVVVCNDFSPETRERLAASDDPVLALAEIPDAAVAHMAAAARFPLVVIDQGFAASCRDFMAARDLSLPDAVRTLGRAQIGANALSLVPRAVVIAPDMHAEAAILVRQIAAAIDAEDTIVETMIADRALDRSLDAVIDQHFSHEPLSSDTHVDTVLDALDRFYGMTMPRSGDPWQIPLELLLDGKSPHPPATRPIELLGPARALTFGPYFYVPGGRWAGAIDFTTTGNIPGNTFGFDVLADQDVKEERRFEIEGSGTYRVTFEFEITDPYHPIEVRTFIHRGAIAGEFRLLSVSLWPASPTQ